MSRESQLLMTPLTARRYILSAFVYGYMCCVLGCGTGPQAEFKSRETTIDLIPNAESAVGETLLKSFGTPSALVAWERFPVAYGGVKGTVAAVAVGPGVVNVTLEGDVSRVKKNSSVVWLTGVAKGSTADDAVVSYNHESKQMTLKNTGNTAAVGDRFVVAFGEDFQFGRTVYMKNCMHCHGVTGDGQGPTGQYLNPRPRDYRSGQFKFTSTRTGEKVAQDDLHRIVKYGIPGTYMPSFLLIGERETAAVVEYVRWLAIRGEFEKRLVAELTSDYSETSISQSVARAKLATVEEGKKKEKVTMSSARKAAKEAFSKFAESEYNDAVEETANLLKDAWERAQLPESVINPASQRVADTSESRERGRLLYLSDKTKCYTCHGETGRGDGGATEDFWPKPGTNEKFTNRGLHDEWGNPLKPRNLTLGQYRGGRRPVDLYRRVYAGIKGTPMPAFGTALKEPEIWDIVNFVMSLPYKSTQPAHAVSTAGNIVKREDQKEH